MIRKKLVFHSSTISCVLAILAFFTSATLVHAFSIAAQPIVTDIADRWTVPGEPGVYTLPVRFDSDVVIPPLYYELSEPLIVSEGEAPVVTIGTGPLSGKTLTIQYSDSENSGNIYMYSDSEIWRVF
jgi:hypothetical protein